MNLYQLEYIVAVDRHRHFARAAEACHVTQPTLSAMVHKLEEELGVMIFDRSRTPVVPTNEGKAIIEQARKVLEEAGNIREIASDEHKEIKGELRLGIIPTVAPFLLPMCLQHILQDHPGLKLIIRENTTENIIKSLASGTLDAGILATPLENNSLHESPLYREQFMIYSKEGLKTNKAEKVGTEALDPEKLWLLEEGHCWRNQVVNFCQLTPDNMRQQQLNYEAGSVDTLKRLTDAAGGMTILPELATRNFSSKEQKHLYQFRDPVPARQISMVTYRSIFKKRLIETVHKIITENMDGMTGARNTEIIGI